MVSCLSDWSCRYSLLRSGEILAEGSLTVKGNRLTLLRFRHGVMHSDGTVMVLAFSASKRNRTETRLKSLHDCGNLRRKLPNSIGRKEAPAAAGASTKENPRPEICDRPLAGLALVVRGSSRRIMIMRFRPANISLINRRHYLPRLPLILSSNEKGDQRTLTGHYISISGLPVTRSIHQREAL